MTTPAACENATPRVASRTTRLALTSDNMPRSRRAPSATARTKAEGGVAMNALARLILSRKNELDLTWQELADRGGFTSHSILFSLAKKKEHKSVPRPDTLKKMAKALGVPLDVVKAAAVEAAGYTLQEVSSGLDAAADVRIVALAMQNMSEADRQRIRQLAESYLED